MFDYRCPPRECIFYSNLSGLHGMCENQKRPSMISLGPDKETENILSTVYERSKKEKGENKRFGESP